MKRTFLLLQILAAAVWIWVGIQIVNLLRSPSESDRNSQGQPLSFSARFLLKNNTYQKLKRDPFQSLLYSEKPQSIKPLVAKVKDPVEQSDPFPISVEGILMGDPPVAILKKEGRTELVKQGGEAWDITVVKITDFSVTLRRRGHSIVLKYP